MTRRLYLDMDAILEAMATTSDWPRFLLDLGSGQIELVLDPDAPRNDAGDALVPIPRCPAADGDARARREVLLAEALAWLGRLGIDPDYELRPLPAPRPVGRPDAEPGQSRVGLFDLLLLGVPDPGLTDGKVRRLLRAASAEAAQRAFLRLARELTEHHGITWRTALVEDRASYDVGRCHLAVAGRQVELEVTVPPALAAIFSGDA